MAEIILFPGSDDLQKKKNIKNGIKNLENLVKEGLIQTPEKIKDILQTPLNKISIIDKESLKSLFFDYIVKNMDKENISFSNKNIQASQYLANLFVEIGLTTNDEITKALNNPYFSYWMEKGDFKKAGDVSVYNFVFKKDKTGLLSKKDYQLFAYNGYLNYFGEDFATGVNNILPITEKINSRDSFFERNLKVV
ncbi:hypothetical protein H3C61_03060 [Candidatus Gracilibacteria bacterium]|nr:hypothetical protein [Candidatus Gracilibacteria bacterium]